jgi:hypothetical protein
MAFIFSPKKLNPKAVQFWPFLILLDFPETIFYSEAKNQWIYSIPLFQATAKWKSIG